MSSEKLLPWVRPLLLSSTLTQATIYVLRPMITYRAIELDANTFQTDPDTSGKLPRSKQDVLAGCVDTVRKRDTV
jgi:hypothetical protein